MATVPALTRYDEELGKAMADRLGLPPESTLQEWSAESIGSTGSPVAVKMTTFKVLTAAEFAELQAVAVRRASHTEKP